MLHLLQGTRSQNINPRPYCINADASRILVNPDANAKPGRPKEMKALKAEKVPRY